VRKKVLDISTYCFSAIYVLFLQGFALTSEALSHIYIIFLFFEKGGEISWVPPFSFAKINIII